MAGPVVQVPVEKISDKIADALHVVAKTYSSGYRCRYDPVLLVSAPAEGSAVKQEHCPNCKYEDRKTDEYCRAVRRVWWLMRKLPKQFESEYSCKCPDECDAGI